MILNVPLPPLILEGELVIWVITGSVLLIITRTDMIF
jgi:hypothetical protein